MTEDELTEYTTDLANRGSCFYFPEGWAAPLATGHKYRFFFSSLDGVTRMNDFGTPMNAPNIDWEYLRWDIPYPWTKNDQSMYFTHTYTEYRSNFNMTKDWLPKYNNTIPALESQYVGGQNFWYNET